MNKTQNKKLFKAIEDDDWETVEAILDSNPDDIDIYGFSNRNCRDKTPLMYSMQCENFEIARRLIARGANVRAKMADGPGSSVIALAAIFGHGLRPRHEEWVEFAFELIQEGADPTDGLWPAIAAYRNEKSGMIKLFADSGIDLDRESPSGSFRDLIQINKHLIPEEVLEILGVRDN